LHITTQPKRVPVTYRLQLSLRMHRPEASFAFPHAADSSNDFAIKDPSDVGSPFEVGNIKTHMPTVTVAPLPPEAGRPSARLTVCTWDIPRLHCLRRFAPQHHCHRTAG